MNSSTFQPNWVSLPGDTILDVLNEQNLSLNRFAEKMNVSSQYVEDLIKGNVLITNNVAKQLEEVIGASAEFWMNRENQYRSDLDRISNLETNWLESLPLRDMMKFGWISDSKNKVEACLNFFNVPSIYSWRIKYEDIISQSSFRKSPAHNSKPESISAWLRQAEIQAEAIKSNSWNPELFRKTLYEIRSLTKIKKPSDFIPKLRNACSNCGVALSIVRTPSGCSINGATKFLNSDKALLLLSFRYLSDDQFWFSFFHEAGHLLLHSQKKFFMEIEGNKEMELTKEEEEANEFATNMLIPKEYQQRLKSISLDKRGIIRFAMEIGVSPGIIVGQLQHVGRIEHRSLNNYKRRYNWEELNAINL